MSRSLDPDELQQLGHLFAADLRGAYPDAGSDALPVEDHVVAIMATASALGDAERSGVGWADRAAVPREHGARRVSMSGRMTRRIVTVVAAVFLSLGGLAIAGAFPGSGPEDDDHALVTDVAEDDQGLAGDDQDENEDADDATADDEGENDETDADDDQGENEDADDQDGNGDEQGEDADDQGDDGDDQGENDSDEGENDEADDAAEDAQDDDGDAHDDDGGAQDDDGDAQDDGGDAQDD